MEWLRPFANTRLHSCLLVETSVPKQECKKYVFAHVRRKNVKEKFVGILGGMGPEATVTMFQNILRCTNAQSDQDHLRILIYNNPKIPDRTAAICDQGEDPLPALIASASLLEKAGVDLIVIPCVTAHYFYESIQAAVHIPILHIVKETLSFASEQHPECTMVGLLSTMGTVKTGLFQRFSAEWGINILTPPEPMIRQYVVPNLCSTCHGFDGLRRFLYYHNPEKRRELIREYVDFKEELP